MAKSAQTSVAFEAVFKPSQVGVALDGDGDGGAINLMFDAKQVPKVIEAWVRFAGGPFKVTFTEVDK